MKSRQEIKALAKSAAAEQRRVGILTLFLYTVIVLAGAIFNLFPPVGSLIVLATVAFIDFPLGVGVEGVFIKIFNREKTSVGEMFSSLSVNYMRKVGGMLWMMLFIYLWTFLLIVPGIIKAFAYSMTPYILADCPNVNAKEALKLSMRMTDGHKGKLFVLMLSWIGWGLLNVLTLGLLGIFFLNPYMSTTGAGFYVELRDQAIANGKIEQSELA